MQQQAGDVFIDIKGTAKLDVPVWNFTICDLQKCAARHEHNSLQFHTG